MTSIFDPPAGARTFNASDWLAATPALRAGASVDVQLQAPPSAPAAAESKQITDETTTEDRGPWEATQPAVTPRRLRNLPWAMLTWLVIAGGVNYVLYRACLLLIAAGHDYTLENLIVPALLVLAITALELLIWLALAWRFDCL